MFGGFVKCHLNSCLCNSANHFKSLTVACFCQTKANPVWQQKKSMSSDQHEKANYVNTSCPKTEMYFSLQDCLSEGTNVDHFMKWSRKAV